MIKEFTDRRPALSAGLIVALFTLVPGCVMLLAALLSGGRENAAGFVLIPFLMSLLGLIVSEIVYTVSAGMRPVGTGPGALAMLFSTAAVTLFGAEAAGSVGGLLLYVVISILKKLWELIPRP